MTQLNEILDTKLLEELIHDKYIYRRFHPEFPELAILNYSDKTAFAKLWNRETMNCRGLIYNTETGEVLARPFAKFFNHGQEAGVQYDLDALILGAWDKADGSLGILYETPDGKNAIATRGSFESEQAIHATKLLREAHWHHDGAWRWSAQTPLFEIVYPENRIVLDYGWRDELIYLGNVTISTGTFNPPPDPRRYDEVRGVGRIVDRIPVHTLREALEREPRPNAEGMVIWFDNRTAVKLKQADYMALHKIVFGLSVKEVWRQLVAGTYDEWAKALPDEFHKWAEDAARELRFEFALLVESATAAYDSIALTEAEYNLESRGRRKAFALAVKDEPYKNLLFKILDGSDIAPIVWAMIEPKSTTDIPA